MATATATEEVGDVFADGTVSVPEAERFTSLRRATIYALMASGDLKFTKIGARRLIARRSMLALLPRGTGNTTAE